MPGGPRVVDFLVTIGGKRPGGVDRDQAGREVARRADWAELEKLAVPANHAPNVIRLPGSK